MFPRSRFVRAFGASTGLASSAPALPAAVNTGGPPTGFVGPMSPRTSSVFNQSVNFNISAIDAGGVDAVIRQQSGTIVGVVAEAAASSLAVRRTVRLLGLMAPPELPEEGPRIQATISLEELVHFNIEAHLTADHFDDLFQDHPKMELYYEDVLDDRERAYTQVQAFLGVEPRSLFDTTRRQHPEPLRELVANLDELYEAVKRGPHTDYYSPFFD